VFATDNNKTISLDRRPGSGAVHNGVVCDECYATNIRGIRYKCG